MPDLAEVATLMARTLNPPVESILELLVKHQEVMELARDPRPLSFNERRRQIEQICTESPDKRIVDWLICHIPHDLLKEAAGGVEEEYWCE